MHLLGHWLGLNDPSGPIYAFWSGFAGDIPMFGIFIVLYRKHNCHGDQCWRIARHHVVQGDTNIVLCRKHYLELAANGDKR